VKLEVLPSGGLIGFEMVGVKNGIVPSPPQHLCHFSLFLCWGFLYPAYILPNKDAKSSIFFRQLTRVGKLIIIQ
jgi:hypothetical protein